MEKLELDKEEMNNKHEVVEEELRSKVEELSKKITQVEDLKNKVFDCLLYLVFSFCFYSNHKSTPKFFLA